ncbi:MAG: biotin--[acetyl-CoA-carboxylase] ligase [Acetanaerobacterium sp.]
MTVKESIVSLLDSSKGTYISGENIASRLSVTRSAVWKAIKALQSEGYHIEAVTNKGYSLSPDTDILSVQSILKYLDNSAKALRIEVHKTVSSTNSIARELAMAGEPEGRVVVSEEQTNGRGRRGRRFFSSAGAGIYMSLLLRPTFSAVDAALLTAAAAVAVAVAIEQVSGRKTQIKWVNDIYMDGKKVCGILTEASSSLENGGLEYAILGIGINSFEPQGGYPNDIADIAAPVFNGESGTEDVRNRLAAAVLSSFMVYYGELDSKAFLQEYKKRSLVIGKNITVINGTGSIPAQALDIDDVCHLKVRYEDGREEYLSSGEISIRV